MKLGEYIKQYRFEHGMSLRDFEKCSGISKTRLSAYESGENKPSFKTFAAIATACGLTPVQLANICNDTKITHEQEQMVSERERLKIIVDELSDEQVHALLELYKVL